MPYIPYTRQVAIALDNLLIASGALLTASSEQDGFEVENIADGFTYDFWRPSGADATPAVQVELPTAQPADYFAIHAHNLATIGGTVELQGSADGIIWTSLSGPHAPANNGPQLWERASVSYKFYQVLVTGVGVSIGVLQIGALTVLPEGMYIGTPIPRYNRQTKIQNQRSVGGQLLGRSRVAQGVVTLDVSQDHVTEAWVDTVWASLIDDLEMRPFFFSWRKDDRPLDVMYAWTADATSQQVAHQSYYQVRLSLEGQVYEPSSEASGA